MPAITCTNLWQTLRRILRADLIKLLARDYVIEDALRNLQITVSDSEVDEQVSAVRKQNRLFTQADVLTWLKANSLTEDECEKMCAREAQVRKLKEHLFGGTVKQEFAFRKTALVKAELYRMFFKSKEKASEISAALSDSNDFFRLARLYSEDQQTARQCGYLGFVPLQSLPPAAHTPILNAAAGQIIGPLPFREMWHLYRFESLIQPVFDDVTRQMLIDQMYAEWLDQGTQGVVFDLVCEAPKHA